MLPDKTKYTDLQRSTVYINLGEKRVLNRKKLSICILLFTALLRAHCQIDIAKGFIAGQDLAKKQCDSTGTAPNSCQLH